MTTLGETFLPTIMDQSSHEEGNVFCMRHLNLWNSSLHQGDGVKKAEAIRVDPLLEGSLVHQATQHEMGDEQCVDFLDDPNGLVAAQRVIDEPLMDVSLINRDLNLPPFVVGDHHF